MTNDPPQVPSRHEQLLIDQKEKLHDALSRAGLRFRQALRDQEVEEILSLPVPQAATQTDKLRSLTAATLASPPKPKTCRPATK